MDCAEARELFSPYIDGVLTQERKLALEQHLGCCLMCRQEFKDWVEVVELLHSLPPVSPPPDFSSTLHQKLEAAAKASLWRRPISQGQRRVMAVAVACCLLVGTLVSPSFVRHQVMGLLAGLGDRVASLDLGPGLDSLGRNHAQIGWKWFPGLDEGGSGQQPGGKPGSGPGLGHEPGAGPASGSNGSVRPPSVPGQPDSGLPLPGSPGESGNTPSPPGSISPGGPVDQLPSRPSNPSPPEANPPSPSLPGEGVIVDMPKPKPVGVTKPERRVRLQLAFALEVNDFDQGLAVLRGEVAQRGGSLKVKGPNQSGKFKAATMNISVPFPVWDQLVVAASRTGTISAMDMQRTDLNSAFDQTLQRLQELRQEEAVLTGQERQAADLATRAQIQDQLLSVRDELAAQYRYFDSLCDRVNTVQMEIRMTGLTAPPASNKAD